MNIQILFPVLKQVFTSPYVIITVIVIFLYMDFCIYVANYVKKAPKTKKKKSVSKIKTEEKTEENKNTTEQDESSK